MASIRKRGSIWWIAYRQNGTNVEKSLKTSDGRKALELKKKLEGLLENNLVPEPSKTPIGPFIQSLAEHWKHNRSPKGAANDLSRLRSIFGPCCPALILGKRSPKKYRSSSRKLLQSGDPFVGGFIPIKKLEDLTPNAISRYLKARQEADDLNGKTVNHLRAVLSAIFSFAIEYHNYRCPDARYKNPIEGVSRFKEFQKSIVWLNNAEIEKQLNALSDIPQLRAMVATYIFAGLRRSETVWLTNDDVDLIQRVIRIQPKEFDEVEWRPKTGRSRIVPISTKLLAELRAFLPHRQESDWFFSTTDGKRFDPDNFSTYLREENQKRGIEWSCCEYRHTFGSHLAQLGRSLYQISALMGNSPEICRKHYAQLLTNEMHAEVDF